MVEQSNKYTIPMWAVIAASIVLTVLFIKFCTNNGNTKKVDTAPTQQKHLEDSTRMAQEAQEYKEKAQANLQRAKDAERKYEAVNNKLTNVIEENKRLIKNRRKFIFNASDTGIITVPQEFIDDCEGCFTQLAKTNDSAIAHQQEADALRTVLQAQNKADSQRIVQLEDDKLSLNKRYNDMRVAAEVNAKHMEPRRKIKTGLVVPFTNTILPNGVGVGLMYQDKKDRNFGAEAVFGRQQPLYLARMYVPFTLRN